jgi:acetolactate synthase-1/3 small subunit
MRHIISLLLQNEAGSLMRVAGLFSERNYNIESLSVAATSDPAISRLTVAVIGSDRVIEQITLQVGKLVDVIAVDDLTSGPHLERELLLVKVRIHDGQRNDVLDLVTSAHGRVLDDTSGTYTIQLAGSSEEIDQFIKNLASSAKLAEVVRSGVAAVTRGDSILEITE